MWQALLIGVVMTVVIIYIVVHGIKIIHPPEMAVLVIFGKPVSFWDSGFHFNPLLALGRPLGCYVTIFPKKRFNLDYKKKKVITKEGFYPDGAEEYPKGTKRNYGSQVLTCDPTAYLTLPRKKRKIDGKEEKEHPLFEIFRSKVPTDEKGLLSWTEEAVSSALRVAFGGVTWKEAIEKLYILRKRADEEFKNSDGALVQAGFDPEDIRLTLPEINLPERLEKALPRYDEQRIESESAHFEAQQRAIETVGAVIESFCEETGMSRESVQKELKDNAQPFIDQHKDTWERNWDIVHRRMGIEGKSYLDFRVPGGTTLEGLVALLRRTPMGTGEEKKEKEGGKKKEEKKNRVEAFLDKARTEGKIE